MLRFACVGSTTQSELEWCMFNIELLLVVDLFLVIGSVLLLMKFSDLRHSHPATVYLIFHVFVVTSRLFALINGAPTLFTDRGYEFMPVTLDEITRATILLQIALVFMTIGWIKASWDHTRNTYMKASPLLSHHPLSLKIVKAVVSITLPVGLFGLIFFAYIPFRGTVSLTLNGWEDSHWFLITQTWVGLSMLALIYCYGLRKPFVIMLIIYLIIMALQGYGRFRVVIPLILLIQIYLDRRQRRWPSATLITLILAGALLFFPLKTVAKLVQQKSQLPDLQELVMTTFQDVVRGQNNNQEFLDQFAAALPLIDGNGKVYYGSTYLVLLSAPIPRQLWPNKPSLAQYINDISLPWRPMFKLGMIVTFLGEAYANFRYMGIIFVPLLFAYWLGRLHLNAYKLPYLSVERFAYLLICCNLIQVFRDGLVSLVVFIFINMMPLALIAMLHLIGESDFLPHNRYRRISYSVRSNSQATVARK